MSDLYKLTDEEFNGLLDDAMSYIENTVKEGDVTAFMPTLIVHGADKEGEQKNVIVVMPDFDMEKRYEVLEAMGNKFGHDGILARCIFFLTEAWMSHHQYKEGTKVKMMPRDDPKRIEVVQAGGMAHDQRASLGQLQVKRDKKGRMVAGEKFVYHYRGDVEVQNNICRAFYKGQAIALIAELVQEHEKKGKK